MQNEKVFSGVLNLRNLSNAIGTESNKCKDLTEDRNQQNEWLREKEEMKMVGIRVQNAEKENSFS